MTDVALPSADGLDFLRDLLDTDNAVAGLGLEDGKEQPNVAEPDDPYSGAAVHNLVFQTRISDLFALFSRVGLEAGRSVLWPLWSV